MICMSGYCIRFVFVRTVSEPCVQTLIKTCNFVTFYKFLIHLGVHHTICRTTLKYSQPQSEDMSRQRRRCYSVLRAACGVRREAARGAALPPSWSLCGWRAGHHLPANIYGFSGGKKNIKFFFPPPRNKTSHVLICSVNLAFHSI